MAVRIKGKWRTSLSNDAFNTKIMKYRNKCKFEWMNERMNEGGYLGLRPPCGRSRVCKRTIIVKMCPRECWRRLIRAPNRRQWEGQLLATIPVSNYTPLPPCAKPGCLFLLQDICYHICKIRSGNWTIVQLTLAFHMSVIKKVAQIVWNDH